jgi:uncharacterized protein YkwD
MTVYQAKHLFVWITVPFFLCTAVFLVLRDPISGGRVNDEVQEPVSQAADSKDSGGWFSGWLFRSPQHKVHISDEYFQQQSPLQVQDSITMEIESEIAVLTNVMRTDPMHALNTLTSDSTIANVARVHSRDMAEQGISSDQSPGGLSFAERVSRDKPGLQGEARGNIFRLTKAKSFTPLEIAGEALLSWMNTSSKRSRLLWPDCSVMGVGVWRKGDDTYCITQVFFKPEVRFGPELEMSYRSGTVKINGEFVEKPDTSLITMSLVTPPGFFDIPRRLGYRPRKVIDLQPRWLGPTEFSVSLPCKTEGVYEMRFYDRGRIVAGHVFRVD